MGKLTIKQRFLSLLKMNNTPEEIALGVSLGVFIGVTPLYGFHTLMVILFALAVKKANKIANKEQNELIKRQGGIKALKQFCDCK